MWNAIVIELETVQACTVPRTLGMAVHGWFLRHVVAPWQPDLAAELHNGSAPRPFALSDVAWRDALPPGPPRTRAPMPAGAVAEVRLAAVEPELARRLAALAAPGAVPPLELDHVPLRARRVWTTASEHPAAGALDAAAAVASAAAIASQPLATRFDLVSPTHFEQDGQLVHRPDARLCFGSWVRRWNATQPDHPWPDTLADALADAAVVRTVGPASVVRTDHAEHSERGVVGTYEVRLPQDGALRLAGLALLTFAQWAGTGKGTVWGLGQTRTVVAPLAIGHALAAAALPRAHGAHAAAAAAGRADATVTDARAHGRALRHAAPPAAHRQDRGRAIR